MAAAGVVLSFAVRPLLGVVAVSYLALTTSYSIWWRSVAIVDIVAVAAGFLLRAVAGGAAVGVPLSAAFLIVTFASAVFLIAGKRYAELSGEVAGAATRRTLARYSRSLLRRVLIAAAAVACIAYARWAFGHPELGVWSAISLVPFAMWLGRYAVLLGAGAGEAPEDLILRDPELVALAALWLALFLGGAHAAR
jgi:decaprenyl-phosphate phosphoribosyltransferase